MGVPVSTRFRATAIVGSILIATLGVASPAFADSWSIKDPARDMVGYCDGGGDCPAGGIDASRTDGDMRSSWVTHSSKNLLVRTHFTGLNKPSGKKGGAWVFLIETNEDRLYQLVAGTGGTKDGKSTDGVTFLFNMKIEDGYPVPKSIAPCSGRKTSIRYEDDEIQVIIPRTCMSNPYKLRIGAFYYQRPTTANGLDGYRDTTLSTSWSPWLTRG